MMAAAAGRGAASGGQGRGGASGLGLGTMGLEQRPPSARRGHRRGRAGREQGAAQVEVRGGSRRRRREKRAGISRGAGCVRGWCGGGGALQDEDAPGLSGQRRSSAARRMV